MVDIMKWGWIAMGPGQVTSVAARVSIAISLVSLFGVHAWFKWFLIVLTSVATSLGIIMIVLSYTQARPVEAIWNVFMTGPGVYRLDTRVFLYFGYITQSQLARPNIPCYGKTHQLTSCKAYTRFPM